MCTSGHGICRNLRIIICKVFIHIKLLKSEAKISLSKNHKSVLRKITIDLSYFWDVYDVNLREKNSAEVRLIHAEQISCIISSF